MSNDLITDLTTLDHLLGAPFTAAEVDAAVAELRAELRWHVAPVRVETGVTLDLTTGERFLRLPTAKLVSVEEIRDVTGDVPATFAASEYRVSHKLAQAHRTCAYWPSGFEAVEVDMTHGYEACPDDLLEVIAGAIRDTRGSSNGVATSVTNGSHQVAFERWDGASAFSTSATLNRYRIFDWGFA